MFDKQGSRTQPLGFISFAERIRGLHCMTHHVGLHCGHCLNLSGLAFMWPLATSSTLVGWFIDTLLIFSRWLKAGDVSDIEDIKPCSGAVILENHHYVAVYKYVPSQNLF
jgi:hypothetical protein